MNFYEYTQQFAKENKEFIDSIRNLDETGITILAAKTFTGELSNVSEASRRAIQESKCGEIEVTKLSENLGNIQKGDTYRGFTPAFGEGVAVYISNPREWFRSSTIQSIDWDKGTFKTLNSTYSFKFKEIAFNESKNS
jgi:hypothetical protein